MSKSKPEIAKGNLIAFWNERQVPGGRQPMFKNGRISAPGGAQKELTLWPFEYRDADGVVLMGFNGTIGPCPLDAPPMDQIQAMMKAGKEIATIMDGPNGIKLEAGRVVFFTNKFRTDDNDQPYFYGYANPGDGTPMFYPDMWMNKQDSRGKPMATGSTQYELTAEQRVALGYDPKPSTQPGRGETSPDTLDDLFARGDVTRGMPDGGRGDESEGR